MSTVELFTGVVSVLLGAYLFWEPSYGGGDGFRLFKPSTNSRSSSSQSGASGELGRAARAVLRPAFIPGRGLRIYRGFAFVGAFIGFVAASLVNSSDINSSFGASQSTVLLICIAVCSFIGYILPKVAENYIVMLGPPVAVVLGYEYLVYEKGIDLQELVAEIPHIPEIDHSLISGLILVSTTFLTFVFRMHLRGVVPILMSGIFSGLLIGNGASIIDSNTFPLSTEEIELRISAIIAFCSISLQIYVKYYGRERGKKKQRAKDRDRRVIKRTGDLMVLKCPQCLDNAPHTVVRRKETSQGVELMVNCRGTNQFDEVCNFHHTVIEVHQ